MPHTSQKGLVVVVALALAGCGSTALDEKALQKEVESVGSAAAEGALLAHEAASGRVTSAFTRVHSDALAKQTRKVEKKLHSAKTPQGLDRQRQEAEQLARQVEEDLGRLHGAADDEVEAAKVASRLEDDSDAADELAK